MQAIGAKVLNPTGEHPYEMLETAQETVREKWSKSDLADGEELEVGTVTYTADEVVAVDVSGPEDTGGPDSDFPGVVLRQQEAIRRSGAINMFDKAGVRCLAEEEFGFDELAEWLAGANAEEYFAMAERAAEEGRE